MRRVCSVSLAALLISAIFSARAECIAILERGEGCRHVADILLRSGLSTRLVSPDALGDPASFSRANADLLVIPCSPYFPAEAADNFKRFLKDGGAFFAFGGYAFDKMVDTSGADRSKDVKLNSRYGKKSDTVKFENDVVAVFDPSFLVRNASSVVASEGQNLFAAETHVPFERTSTDWFAAVAMTGSNDPVFAKTYARFVPVLEAKDRFGRPVGPVLSMVLNHSGPYAGSAWAFSGHPTMFKRPDAVCDKVLVSVCRRLLSPGCISALSVDRMSALPGETISATAAAFRLPDNAECRFSVGKRTVGTCRFADGAASAAFALDSQCVVDKGVVEIVAEVLVGGNVMDTVKTGVAVKGDANGPDIAFKDNMFSIDGRRRFFGGMNTTGIIMCSETENPLVWERDFSDMADYGMKFFRILHFSPFAQERMGKSIRAPNFLVVPPMEKTVRRMDAIVDAASANGVGIWLTLHDWMPWELEPDELRPQEAWGRYWAGRYKDNPGVFFDIQNEPDPIRWKKFSAAKSWRDTGARDGERKRASYFARWQKANGDAVHAANPRALVSVGHLQTLDAVEKHLSTEGIDFMDIHHYGGAPDLRGVVKLTDRRFEDKGFSLGEFGAGDAHDARGRGETGDPSAKSIRHFLHVNHYVFAMGGAFTGVWDWKEMQDCVFPWGVTWQDGTPKPVLKAYRNMCLLLGEAGAIREEPVVWLVLPDSFRLGGDSGRIHRAVQRAADSLISVNVPFGVINEEALSRLPQYATALVWPIAVCPTDAVFSRVREFVAKGGALLVTGDFRYDADRKPTRGGRLAELGLSADFPPLDPMNAKVPDSAAVQVKGKVLWSPTAVELVGSKPDSIELYRRFADEVAHLPRLKVGGVSEGTVARFASRLEDGGLCETAVNTSDGEVSFDDVRLSGQSIFWRRKSKDGGVTALALSGRTSEMSVTGAPCAWLSLDGNPIGESRAFAVLPYGPGKMSIKIPSGVAGEIGEFRHRRWHRLDAASSLVFGDDETVCDIRLFAAPEMREKAVSRLEELL